MFVLDPKAHLLSWHPKHRYTKGSLSVDPAEVVQNNLISSKAEKRTLETNIWYKKFSLSLALLFSLSLSLLLLPSPPNQPQYKSALKTMWALAVIAVSFDWWIHTRLGHYKSCLCGTSDFSQDFPKYIWVVSISGLYHTALHRTQGISHWIIWVWILHRLI